MVVLNNKGDKLIIKELIKNKVDLSLIDLLDEKTYHELLSIKNREYLMTPEARDMAFYGLLDCVLAFLYDWRVTEFESNCESHWTITKISATLSAFVTYESLKEMLISFSRRSLTYPFYRHFDISLKVIDDLKMTLLVGKKMLLKFLLTIKNTFNTNNPKYLLNNIYIDDHCVFVQQLDDKYIKEKLNDLIKTKVYFEDLGFPEIDDEDDKGEEEETE